MEWISAAPPSTPGQGWTLLLDLKLHRADSLRSKCVPSFDYRNGAIGSLGHDLLGCRGTSPLSSEVAQPSCLASLATRTSGFSGPNQRPTLSIRSQRNQRAAFWPPASAVARVIGI